VRRPRLLCRRSSLGPNAKPRAHRVALGGASGWLFSAHYAYRPLLGLDVVSFTTAFLFPEGGAGAVCGPSRRRRADHLVRVTETGSTCRTKRRDCAARGSPARFSKICTPRRVRGVGVPLSRVLSSRLAPPFFCFSVPVPPVSPFSLTTGGRRLLRGGARRGPLWLALGLPAAGISTQPSYRSSPPSHFLRYAPWTVVVGMRRVINANRPRFLESRLGCGGRRRSKTLKVRLSRITWSLMFGEIAMYCFLVLVADGRLPHVFLLLPHPSSLP